MGDIQVIPSQSVGNDQLARLVEAALVSGVAIVTEPTASGVRVTLRGKYLVATGDGTDLPSALVAAWEALTP